MSENKNVSHWIDQIKEGDSIAANRLWHHYFDRLVRSVRQRMGGQNRAVTDEEDIVLSVFDSFYAAAGQGRFPTSPIGMTFGGYCCKCRRERLSTSGDTTRGSDVAETLRFIPSPLTRNQRSKRSAMSRHPKWF